MWIDAIDTRALEDGDWHTLFEGDYRIAVIKVDGVPFAIEDRCSHAQMPLTDGWIEGDEIICPRHAARFNIKTGEALSPPAYLPIATYATRVMDSMIQVHIPDSTGATKMRH